MLLGQPDNKFGQLRPPRHQGATQLASVCCVLVSTGKAWAIYIVLRVLFFAVPFTVLFAIGWPWWLALAVATLIALALSVIFLSKQRDEASTSIYEWRMRDRTADDIDEDAALDATATGTTEQPAMQAPAGEQAAPSDAENELPNRQ